MNKIFWETDLFVGITLLLFGIINYLKEESYFGVLQIFCWVFWLATGKYLMIHVNMGFGSSGACLFWRSKEGRGKQLLLKHFIRIYTRVYIYMHIYELWANLKKAAWLMKCDQRDTSFSILNLLLRSYVALGQPSDPSVSSFLNLQNRQSNTHLLASISLHFYSTLQV